MFSLNLEKAEEPEIKLPASVGSSKKQENSRKTIATVAAKSHQLCPTLCDLIDGSPPGSPVHRILQARTLERVAISFSNACMHAKSLQSCPTLCDAMDGSPSGSHVHLLLLY